jgi:5-methylcytosine-specific restriction endonuclease McrA
VRVTGANDPNFYRSWNHQALCEPCHNAKRARESREQTGVGINPRGRRNGRPQAPRFRDSQLSARHCKPSAGPQE